MRNKCKCCQGCLHWRSKERESLTKLGWGFLNYQPQHYDHHPNMEQELELRFTLSAMLVF